VSVLDEILTRKRMEVEARRAAEPLEALRRRAAALSAPRSLEAALRGEPRSASGLRIIAEIKRASPSRGPIRPGADATAIARLYEAAGATALSVLTDGPSFGGSLEDLVRAREASAIPALRKDFIIDAYQVWEARAAGADAVLLIAAALDDKALRDLAALARELGLSVLVEVHDRQELERASEIRPGLLGINNRSLRTLEVTLATTRDLLPHRPPGSLVVSESGFSRKEELEEMRRWGVDAFLIGESLMRAPDPGAALRHLTGGPAARSGPAPLGGPAAAWKGPPALKVKICGITRVEDARLALECGAWAIGFIFHPPSPRYVTVERAAAILRELPAGTLAVGVFVDAPLAQVNSTVRAVGLRGVQLHGTEGPEFAAAVEAGEVIKGLRVGPGFDAAAVDAFPQCRILLDAFQEGVPGGTGKVCDWKTARKAQERRPIILAGGLEPANVVEAVTQVKPDGIDVSSGVEARPGIKDPVKIRRLFQALVPVGGPGARS